MRGENYFCPILFQSFEKKIIFILLETVTSFYEGVFLGEGGLHTERNRYIAPDYLGDFGEDSSIGVLGSEDDAVGSWIFSNSSLNSS